MMKPRVESLTALAPELPPALVEAAVTTLSDEYFSAFDAETCIAHLRLVSQLTASAPVFVRGEVMGETARVTVVAYDVPGEFSWISGLMSSLGGDVRSGDVFTFSVASATPAAAERIAGPRTSRRRPVPSRAGPAAPDVFSSGRIIDAFQLAALDRPLSEWTAALEGQLRRLFRTFQDNRDAGAVRKEVNDLVADSVRSMREVPEVALQPVTLTVRALPDEPRTEVVVQGQDTPAFLYCLANAMAANGIYIDAVRIRTVADQAIDTFWVSTAAGRPLTSAEAQDRLRSAVVLTKQFSHLLGSAADPYKALVHFNSLMDRFDQDAVFTRYSSLLQNPVVLRNLARVLGAGDFLWEEFLRLGYGNVLPLLADRPAAGDGGAARGAVTTRAAFRAGLTARLREARTPEARRLALNEFKDFEIFKADLQYLLDPYMTQDAHAAVLSNLAEAVVETAALCAEEEMRQEYGEPRNVAGRPCTYALMALGKLGGRELGYASDLELLTVFSGRGATAGPRQIPADEYFVRLVERLRDMIQARRQGIFEVDLRLRPHGGNGPLAVGFESFCHYYANRGEALDYERQALIKMRFLSGDRGLGERLESFRDESLYHSREVRYEAIDDVRRRQHRELAGGDCLNAKFSAGGLVDVEYAVQFLQILNGTAAPNLRTPNTQDALRALGEAGVLMPAESGALHEAYAFLRRLVNALRMLRGHAKDLEIPPFESLEFCHLARRMGYRPRPGLPVAAQLRGELGGHMAYVRDFCRRRFGRPLLITRETGNLADVALTPELSEDVVAGILARNGFQNVSRAAYNLRQLLGESGAERDVFSQLIVLAEPLFRASADADMALNNWERYAGAVISRHGFHESLLREPQQLEIFLNIVAASQFLADVLTRNPECFSWVLEPQELLHPKTREGLAREIAEETMGLRQPEHALNALRRCRRRQLLRIGTRDLCLGVPFTETVADLSWLAAGVVDAVVTLESRHLPQAAALLQDGRLCILALGKLGGAELNYSSDVDLLAYLDDAAAAVSASDLEAASELLRQSIRSLTAATPQGHMYRIDMRLRPFGSQGALVGRLSSLRRYYETQARPWEVQALLKARAVRGEAARAQSLVADLVRGSLERWEYAAFERDALRARRTHLQAQGAEGAELDIKTGPGGIRSIEFGVQLLQLRHLRAHPELFEANTLAAISHLVDLDIVPLGQAAELSGAYLLLRRVEHLLQIMDDRQVHALRRTPEVLRAVGRRLQFQGTTPESVWSAIDGARQTSARFFAQVTGG